MEKRTKAAVIALGAGGLGAAGLYHLAKGKFNEPGGLPVADGALLWTDEFEEGDPDYITDLDGRQHRIGSYGAVNAAYSMAAHYARLLSRATRVVEQMLSPDQADAMYMGFVNTGRFPVDIMNASQQAAASTMLNCAVSFGQSLRVLATVCHHAGVERMYRPTEWVRRHYSLEWIYFGSFLNPLSYHGRTTSDFRTGVRQVHRPSGWMAVGMEIVTRWLEAYRNIDDIQGLEHLVRDFEEAEAILEEGSVTAGSTATAPALMGRTMGAIPAVAIGIAVVIVALGAVVVVYKLMNALTNYLFGNYAYLDDIMDQYEEALECARDEDLTQAVREECARQAETLRQQVQSYTPPLDNVFQVAGYVAIGVGAYVIYRLVR